MAYGGRRPDVPARHAVAWVVGTAAIYVIVFGAGIEKWWVIALGIALVVGAVALVVAPAARGRRPAWIAGTVHVLSASAPPESAAYGRCELRVVVQAVGVPAVAVKIRDPRVPVAKWPEAGATLPVLVAIDNPRKLRILWDEVMTHVEAAVPAEEEQRDDHGSGYDDEPAFLDDPLAPPEFTEEDFTALAGDSAGLSLPPRRRVLPLEDEPSRLVSRYLFPTERYRGEWRRHLVRPGRWYVALLLLAIAGTIAVRQEVRPEYVTATLAAICAAGAAGSGYAVLAWCFGRFVLTNKRMLLVGGILQRRVSSMALVRISDLRFEQSPSGRLSNYGDFIIEGARRFSRMRRIADLPNPNELYLRIVEELYEPAAVEARLGSSWEPGDDRPAWWRDDLDENDDLLDSGPRYTGPREERPGSAGLGSPPRSSGGRFTDSTEPDLTTVPLYPPTETLSLAIREALYGPTLTNYDGWVSVEVLDRGHELPISRDRHVRLEPGRSYELVVVIAADPAPGTAEPLMVTGGVDRDAVEFTVEIDSDHRALRCPSQAIRVDAHGGDTRFTIRTPDEGFGVPPWLWVRVSQQRRLLQSIELTATGPAMLEH